MFRILLYLILLCAGSAAHAYDATTVMGMSISAPVPAPAPAPVTPPVCGQGSMYPAKVCDIGAGFLCVSTPPLSVVEDFVDIKGTVDNKNNVLTSLGVFVQNEYTKEGKQISLPTGSSLGDDGSFSARVPLMERLGPYTIIVTATRESGAAVKATVRTSRVTFPKMVLSDVSLDPDPAKSGGSISGQSVQVVIDLLHSCQFCDFVGITTGGLTATLTNIITNDDGVKQVTQKTNVAVAEGKLAMCVPVANGKNSIHINVCNSATGYDASACPGIEIPAFTASAGGPGLRWDIPPTPIYHAGETSTVELAFKLDGPLSCEENPVRLAFNRDEEQTLCAGPDGEYHLKLKPQVGVNIGTVSLNDESYPFTFGFGDVKSPFEKGGSVKDTDSMWIRDAGGFAIEKSFIVSDVRSFLNNYFKSDQLEEMLGKIPAMMNQGKEAVKDSSAVLADIRGEIPLCGEGKGGVRQGFKLVRPPSVGGLEIVSAEVGQDRVKMTLNMTDIKILAQLFKDRNFDGESDSGVILPIKIAFKKIFTPIEVRVLRSGARPIFVITSENTDCAYKDNHACTGRPAPLVQENFVGGATRYGGFVICDDEDQVIDDDTREACKGVNMADAQTGLFSISVLDTVNEKIYCDGSAALTYFMREWMKAVPLNISPVAGRSWTVPVGLDLLGNRFNVSGNGIFGIVPALVGSPDLYSKFAGEYKNEDVGYIVDSKNRAGPAITSNKAIGLGIGKDFLNNILFVLNSEDPEKMNSGLLDWDVHEVFWDKLGFNFIKECDAFVPSPDKEAPPSACNLRPRVGELLGSALTTAGYFPQKHPLMLRLRANRRLAPHVEFINIAGKQYVDLQVGDVDVSFYALQVDSAKPPDQYGNLSLKLGPSGEPMIQSMNPKDPDPDKGPIIRFKLSALLAFELMPIITDSDDPSRLAMTVRPEAVLSRLVFTPMQGGNATVIKDSSLLSAFEEKLKYGINIYSMPDRAIKIRLPKEIEFRETEGDQFSLFGLSKITFGKDGLQFAVEDSQKYLDVFLKFIVTQVLSVDGQRQTFTIPAQ